MHTATTDSISSSAPHQHQLKYYNELYSSSPANNFTGNITYYALSWWLILDICKVMYIKSNTILRMNKIYEHNRQNCRIAKRIMPNFMSIMVSP